MSVKKFKFVSPGVFVNEIDNSQVPNDSPTLGPIVIGRSEHGPAMRPIKVRSFSEFVDIFGTPVAGGRGTDVWRDGNYTSTMYATFAAQAYLRNNAPLTFVRTLGAQHDQASTAGRAGWKTDAQIGSAGYDDINGGAYGLFIIDSGSCYSPPSIDIGFYSQNFGDVYLASSTGSMLSITSSAGVIDHIKFENTGTNAEVLMASTPSGGKMLKCLIPEAGDATGKTTALNFVDAVSTLSSYTASLRHPGVIGGGHVVTVTPDASIQGPSVPNVAIKVNLSGGMGNPGTIALGLKAAGQQPIHHYTGFQFATSSIVITGSSVSQVGSALDDTPAHLGEVFFGSGQTAGQSVLTGTLAAVFYMNEGAPLLKGNLAGANAATLVSGSGVFIQSSGADKTFKVVLEDSAGVSYKETSFNFNEDSQKFIRKVFNTNPTLVNGDTNSSAKKYWLGETFERMVNKHVTGSTANQQLGILLPLKDDGTSVFSGADQSIQTIPTQASRTGWVFSQDLQSEHAGFTPLDSNRVQKLFRFHSRETGEWEQNNLKISVANIKKSSSKFDLYGKFDILIRSVRDNDGAVKILERFSNCNLNPESPDFVVRKIGDKYIQWTDSENRFREYGAYDNQSKYVRVQIDPAVEKGDARADLLPYGFYGPPRFQGFSLVSGSNTVATKFYKGTGAAIVGHAGPFVEITSSLNNAGSVDYTDAKWLIGDAALGTYSAPTEPYLAVSASGPTFTGSFLFPNLQLRGDTRSGSLPSAKQAYFGIDTTKGGTSLEFDKSYIDIVRAKPKDVDSFDGDATGMEYSFVFTLDDVERIKINSTDTNHYQYVSGSRAKNASYTALQNDNLAIVDQEINKFTMPLFGGFDGLDLREKDPFRNSILADATSETESYELYTLQRSIKSIADPEVVEFNLATIPGVNDSKITDQLIQMCDDRGDALAIIDLPGDYTSEYEGTLAETSRVGSVSTTINNLNARGTNSSYGCAYYPWVQIRDEFTNKIIWMPPSVVALGTMGSSAATSELWFAPAGFVRGGLSNGSAGLPVVGVRQKLTSDERDRLYDANVNPIASFPSEGIVIFGQKTLQVTPSALDRVNVRRAMIFIKKEISRIASTILFEQNVTSTWNRFLDKAEPFLSGVKSRLGLSDYKLVLDSTTTTPDLLDRNIVYAKVFLKPAKAIEFIAIDFTISNTGAAFED